jgi:hypothetical protein
MSASFSGEFNGSFIRAKQIATERGLAYGWEPFLFSEGPVSFGAVVDEAASDEVVHRRDAGVGWADLKQRLRPQTPSSSNSWSMNSRARVSATVKNERTKSR